MAGSKKSGTETSKGGGKKTTDGATTDATTEANIRPAASAANIDPNKK